MLSFPSFKLFSKKSALANWQILDASSNRNAEQSTLFEQRDAHAIDVLEEEIIQWKPLNVITVKVFSCLCDYQTLNVITVSLISRLM
jgi:hypothetical protein